VPLSNYSLTHSLTNPNPRTHPNPNSILTLTGTKFLKENKNDTGT